MWKTLLFALIKKLLEEFLNKEVAPKLGQPQIMTSGGDSLGAECQAVLAACQSDPALAATTAPGTVGHPGGVIQHLQELYTLLAASPRDWKAILACVADLYGHL